ncbi:MAG: peptidylprolyl isomerase [bacterium]
MLRIVSGGFLVVLLFALAACGGKKEKAENGKAKQAGAQSTLASTDRPLAAVVPKDRENYYASAPAMTIDESKRYVATIHTAKGDIVVELDALAAPQHVNNFVFLARQGFYDGLTFHRVERNFVIQGGDPAGTGRGGPGYRIPAEIGLPHHQGVIAMARQGDSVNPKRLSSGSQFYITLKATPFLDGGYSVFGKVTEGFDVVQQIEVGDVIQRVDIAEK